MWMKSALKREQWHKTSLSWPCLQAPRGWEAGACVLVTSPQSAITRGHRAPARAPPLAVPLPADTAPRSPQAPCFFTWLCLPATPPTYPVQCQVYPSEATHTHLICAFVRVHLLSLKCSLRESWPVCSSRFPEGLARGAWDVNIREKIKRNFSWAGECPFGFAGPAESLAVAGTAPPRT